MYIKTEARFGRLIRRPAWEWIRRIITALAYKGLSLFKASKETI